MFQLKQLRIAMAAGLSLDAAVAHGRAINLGQWPLEGFLGEPISFEVAD